MAEVKGLMEQQYLDSLNNLHSAAEELTQKGITEGDLVDDLQKALKKLDQRRIHLANTFDLNLPSPWGEGSELKQ